MTRPPCPKSETPNPSPFTPYHPSALQFTIVSSKYSSTARTNGGKDVTRNSKRPAARHSTQNADDSPRRGALHPLPRGARGADSRPLPCLHRPGSHRRGGLPRGESARVCFYHPPEPLPPPRPGRPPRKRRFRKHRG